MVTRFLWSSSSLAEILRKADKVRLVASISVSEKAYVDEDEPG